MNERQVASLVATLQFAKHCFLIDGWRHERMRSMRSMRRSKCVCVVEN
jgi:hypothetical protein